MDGDDPIFFLALDARGRRVATFRADDALAKEVFYHHADGARGPLCSGGVVMRERNQDLIDDPTTWATDAGDWEGQRDVFCTDFAGNTVALMGAEGLIEQYRYSASGVPLGIPLGDLNGDGVVDSSNTDGDICKAAYSTYEVRADLNLDGVVDNDDLAIVTSADGNTTGRGKFSVASVRNSIGYGGGELFGEGLHAQWNFGGLTVNAGLSSGLTDPSRGGTTSFTIATGSTWNGNCRTDCGVNGCFTGCSTSFSVEPIEGTVDFGLATLSVFENLLGTLSSCAMDDDDYALDSRCVTRVKCISQRWKDYCQQICAPKKSDDLPYVIRFCTPRIFGKCYCHTVVFCGCLKEEKGNCHCNCKYLDGLGRETSDYVGKMTKTACKALPLTTDYTYCWCKGD